MPWSRDVDTQRSAWRLALKLFLAYAALAVVWMGGFDLFSSRVLAEPSQILIAQTIRNWGFVALSAAAGLFVLRQLTRPAKSETAPQQSVQQRLLPVLVSAVVALVIAVMVSVAVWTSLREEKSKVSAQLLAISESKAREIWNWHQERLSDAAWVMEAQRVPMIWLNWRRDPSPRNQRELQELVTSFSRVATAFARIELVDDAGHSIYNTLYPDVEPRRPAESPSTDPVLNAAVRAAIRANKATRVGPWLNAQGEIRMAFIAPFATNTATPFALVLHADPPRYLHAALIEWPLPQESAETFLFTELGGEVLYLSDLRGERDAALRKSVPLAGPQTTARILRGEVAAGHLIEGLDYRGVATLAVAQRIGNTEWWLLAKQDRAELLQNALDRSAWVVMAGILALFAVGGGLYFYDERQRRLRSQSDLFELQRVERALSDSEAKYRLLAENSNDVVWLVDIVEGSFAYTSPSVHRLLGYTPEEVQGMLVKNILPAAARDVFAQQMATRMERFRAGDESLRHTVTELTHVHKDGHLVQVEVTSTLIIDPDGQVRRAQGTTRDITQRKRDQAELTRLSQAIEQSPASVIITDLNAHIEYVNQAFERTSGYSSAEVIGRNPRVLQSASTPPEVYASLWFTLSSGQPWHGEMINRHKSGRDYVQSMTLAPLRSAEGEITHYIAVQMDVTAQKDAENRAHQLAWFNSLSGLPNRNRMMLDIKDAFAEHERTGNHYALLLLNVDRFQNINDALGHAAGDELLVQVGVRLSGLMSIEHKLAHLSADEFAILLRAEDGNAESTSADALRLAQALHEALDAPFRRESGESLTISCCIGIALIPQGEDDAPAEVLRRADTSLHRAKDLGVRHTAMFDASMEQLISRRFQIETDLRRGLGQNELRLYLQPQVNTQGQIVGAEALVRWQHPQHGLLPPGTFIPIAEETGLITEVGDWVLQAVCKELGALRRDDLRLPIAVNVSPRQFHQADFVPSLQNTLMVHGATPEDLVIEITESIVMDQMETVVQKMSHLTSLGVRFALDDFGTGYSSLAYLKRLPIHELKIDRSFVQDAPDDPSDAALVEAILSVAMHLRLKVVAEGVETREQADFLSARGPVIQQGYLHGRPEPAAGLLQRWRALHKRN